MGYVEETGVAQHYRDIRIAPIYEGTNGIQAIDLVGRKIGLRDGGVITDFLAGIDATAAEASAPVVTSGRSASGLPRPTERYARRRRGCCSTAPPIQTAPSPERCRICAWPASSPADGCSPSRRSPPPALLAGDRDGFSTEFLEQKLVTARFYATQLLPQAAGLALRRDRRARRPVRRHFLKSTPNRKTRRRSPPARFVSAGRPFVSHPADANGARASSTWAATRSCSNVTCSYVN